MPLRPGRLSGFKPPWSNEREEINKERESIISALRQAMQHPDLARLGGGDSPPTLALLRSSKVWEAKEPHIARQIAAHNKKVRDHNLTVPSLMHALVFNLEFEVGRL